jgi:hypothetical protein
MINDRFQAKVLYKHYSGCWLHSYSVHNYPVITICWLVSLCIPNKCVTAHVEGDVGPCLKKKMGCYCSSSTYLTTKGTEVEGVQQAALTRLVGIGNSFGRPGLQPFIQKHHMRVINDVSLDACDIQHLLNLRDLNHIMVRWTSNL